MAAPAGQSGEDVKGTGTCQGSKRTRHRTFLQRKFLKGPDGSSEYQDRFRWFTFQDVSNKFTPKSPQVSRAKDKERMDLQTSYEKNYVEHPFKMPTKPKQKPHCPPEGRMNTKTTYQETFTRKEMVDSGPYIPNLPFRLPTKRNDIVSEYQTAYVPMESTRSKPSKMQEALELPKGKFNEVSTVQHDYKEHKNFKRVYPIYQGSREVSGNFNFPYITTYKEAYTTKDHKSRFPKLLKARRQEESHFTDSITRPASFPDYKPKQLQPMVAFEGTTTQRADYKLLPIRRRINPFWIKEMHFQPPQEGMDLDTTYGSDFSDPKVVSTMPPMITQADGKYIRAEAPEDNCQGFPDSIHRTHYTGQYAPAAKPCPPNSDNWQASTCGKIPLCTTYRESYVGESAEQRRIRRLNMKKALESGEVERKTFSWDWVPPSN